MEKHETKKTTYLVDTSTGHDFEMSVCQCYLSEQGKEDKERQPNEIGFYSLDEDGNETFFSVPVHEARAMIKGLEQLIKEANETF